MKKLFMLLVIVGLLNASESMCKDSVSRFDKYLSLLKMSAERQDVPTMRYQSHMLILYSEEAIANCGDSQDLEYYKVVRNATIKLSDGL